MAMNEVLSANGLRPTKTGCFPVQTTVGFQRLRAAQPLGEERDDLPAPPRLAGVEARQP
jgi:hypothetical protein